MTKPARGSIIQWIGPGILVAATGVGAGDLSTGAFTGSLYGLVILWAVIVGAALKFVLNEGLARFQLASGKTILEGCFAAFGPLFGWLFLAYLFIWTFLTAAALMSACGVVMHAILPIFADPRHNKIVWGVAHSGVAIGLIWYGGYRLFERVMSVGIGLMFGTVVLTAILAQPEWTEITRGLTQPQIPDLSGEGLDWTVALLGGVGGTLTIVCYGYWIREEGRTGLDTLRLCRVDLASGYGMTALFGIAMIVIGSETELPRGSSAQTIVLLADQLEQIVWVGGRLARWLFLAGAWAAVASSLLGVWQSIPYLFADTFESLRSHYRSTPRREIATHGPAYRGYLLAMGLLPMGVLVFDFKTVLKFTAICGSLVIPFLAAILLVLGRQQRWLGSQHKNPWWSQLLLSCGLLLFTYFTALQLQKLLGG